MAPTVIFGRFEWDKEKARENVQKHNLDFYTAALAFLDPHRVIAIDEKHSSKEDGFFALAASVLASPR